MSATETQPVEVQAPVPFTDGDKLDDGSTFVRVASNGTFVTSETLAESAKNEDGSRVDIARFEAAFSSFRAQMVEYGNAWRVVNNLTTALAALLMETRLSVILKNGDPDYWGKSRAYRALFSDRIVGWMSSQGFSSSETDQLLQNVRTNYFRTHQTVIEAVAVEEVKRGNVEKLQGVKSAEVKVIEAEDGTKSEGIVITFDKTDRKTGENVVETYTPGGDMPKPLANAVKAAARRADDTATGRKVADGLPSRVTGKDSASGNRAKGKGENQRNYVNEMTAAFESLAAVHGHVSTLALVEALHGYITDLSDYCIGAPGKQPDHGEAGLPGGPRNAIGDAMYGPGNLLLATGKVLAGKGNKTDVKKFRASEEDDTEEENDTPEETPETQPETAAVS